MGDGMTSAPTTSPATVTVRIALIVNAEGGWSAAGWKDGTDEEFFDAARDGVSPVFCLERHSIITVDVPVPGIDQITEGVTVEAVERNPLVLPGGGTTDEE